LRGSGLGVPSHELSAAARRQASEGRVYQPPRETGVDEGQGFAEF